MSSPSAAYAPESSAHPIERGAARISPRGLEWRYLLAMLSAALIAGSLGAIAIGMARGADHLPDLLTRVTLVLGILNPAGAILLFRPIRRYLASPDAALRAALERRIRALPALSGLWISMLTAAVLLSHSAAMQGSWGVFTAAPRGILLGTLVHVAVFAGYLGLYTYHLVVHSEIGVRRYLWRWGETLAPRPGRFVHRMLVTFAAAGIAPVLVMLSDRWMEAPPGLGHGMGMSAGQMGMQMAHMRQTLELDVLGALLLTAIVVILLARGLARPVELLLDAMRRVDRGDLTAKAPLVSDDEFGLLTGQFNRMLDALRERERMRDTFSRFVPESVAGALLADRGAIAPQEQEATVLFTDIEQFTAIAAARSPGEVLKLLNGYFDEVAGILHRHGGVITQFQGDAVLASFNLPAAAPDHARRAVEAALEIQARLAVVSFEGGVRLRTRVGVSSGRVVGGTVGGGERLGYTVHGDTVNLAARLEALNKDFGTRVLISARTAELLRGTIDLRPRGSVAVRGFDQPVDVFEPLPGSTREVAR